MTDHASNFGISQLLGDSSTLLWIRSVIFCHQLQGNLLATDGDTLGIEFFDSHLGAVFVVFTQVGNRAAGWTNVGNGDNSLRHRNAGRQGNDSSRNDIQLQQHKFSNRVRRCEHKVSLPTR